jgi:hypothetical protein
MDNNSNPKDIIKLNIISYPRNILGPPSQGASALALNGGMGQTEYIARRIELVHSGLHCVIFV